jgi:transposase-like protein
VEEPTFNPDEPEDQRSARRAVLVELIAEGSNLSEAARAVGINRSTLFRWRQADPEFDKAIRSAFVASVEALKREAERRAMNGSDKLLMFLLCNYAPDQFSNLQKLEHSGSLNVQQLSDEQLNAEIARLAAIATLPPIEADADCPLV